MVFVQEVNVTSYNIRNMELHELKDIYERIVSDFAAGEYPPYSILYKHLDKGVQKGFILSRDDLDIAYSICAEGNKSGYVLISLLAVYRGHRGEGAGTILLEEIKNMFSDSKGIIIEVEKPEIAETMLQRDICNKRINFYKKAGFKMVPGIDYSIWDIPMHLMVYPSVNENVNDIGSTMYEIYLSLMGEDFIHKMKFSIKT